MKDFFDSPRGMLRRIHYLLVTALACWGIYLFSQALALSSNVIPAQILVVIVAWVGMAVGFLIAIVSLFYFVMKPIKKEGE